MHYWPDETMKRYREYHDQAKAIGIKEFLTLLFPDVQFANAATDAQITEAEEQLHLHFPAELRRYLQMSNGILCNCGTHVLYEISELVNENRNQWETDWSEEQYMPFNNLLFFGRSGCGDLYAYPIFQDRAVGDFIYKWDHETDGRGWKATDLLDLFIRLKVDPE